MRQFLRRYYVLEIATVAAVATMVAMGLQSNGFRRVMVTEELREMDRRTRRANAGTIHEDAVNYPSERGGQLCDPNR